VYTSLFSSFSHSLLTPNPPPSLSIFKVLGKILKMHSFLAGMLAAASMAVAQTIQTSEPTIPEIQAAAATTLPLSPTSNIKGVAFDRFIQVWLENTVSGITLTLT
jgi:hypothetical protein